MVSAFPEFADAIAGCPPGCSHLEAGCALDEWVAEHGGPAEAARLDSLRRLLRSQRGPRTPRRSGRGCLSATPAQLTGIANVAAQRRLAPATSNPGLPWQGQRCLPLPLPGMAGFDGDLGFAHVLADAADDITMRRFRSLDLRVEAKPDLTPVSDADLAVEESLRNVLSRARPRDAMLGEEFGRTGSSQRCWVIDPIDGTKNYVRGVPVWATLIGLMDEDEVIVGVVSAPALGRRWWAARDGGAWTGKSMTKAAACRVSQVASLSDASLVLFGPVDVGAGRAAQRVPRPDPEGLAYPGIWRFLVSHARRRGRGGHLGRDGCHVSGTWPLSRSS